ncbi:hypothetical protein KW786_02320 [Candidatus Parcubacteria bacterium]|nr:hypothetical protein [Candidatus Parcubacteria bacterium]
MNKKFIIIGVAIIIVIFVILAVAAIMKNAETPKDLQQGWTYKHSSFCNVDIPLPPKEGQYVSAQGEYWRFEENSMTEGNPFFPGISLSIFQNPEAGGSGYVAGAVLVSCRPNKDHDSTEMLADKYAQYLMDMGKDAPKEAKLTLTKKGTETWWGKDVLVVSMSGGMFNPDDRFYMLTTPETSYLISKPQMSTDQFLRQTTEEIFSKLKFK